MLELSVACKYLIPRWRQLSVSIISLISMLVIALVVWLIVVFFSVKDGLEASWIDKLISLTAPVRIVPTDHYYHSYYYLVDSISAESDYTLKTIREKLEAPSSNPYDPSSDEEPPLSWLRPDLEPDGSLNDPVKKAYQTLASMAHIPGLQVSDFEMTIGTLRLRLLRRNTYADLPLLHTPQQNFIEQNAYIGTFDPETHSLAKALILPSPADLSNLLNQLGVSAENIKEDQPEMIIPLSTVTFRQRLKEFFKRLVIAELQTPSEGWNVPLNFLPAKTEFKGYLVYHQDRILQMILPLSVGFFSPALTQMNPNDNVIPAAVKIVDGQVHIRKKGETWEQLPTPIPLFIEKEATLSATLDSGSLEQVKKSQDLRFEVHFTLQGIPIKGTTTLGNLEIKKAEFIPVQDPSPYWLSKLPSSDGQWMLSLPTDPEIGEGILLPRRFKDSGALLGDQGYLSYYTATASSVQEQRVPIFVAGFYDPGIMPIGGKYILASRDTTAMIRSAYNNQEDAVLNNGINVRFDNLQQAPGIKTELIKAFQEQKIAP